MAFFGIILSDNRTKVNSVISFIKKTKTKSCWRRNCLQWLWILSFSERESHFSLKYWAIRPSELFGTRRKVTLRIEAHSWAPVLGVFDKLREVGVSSYLSFTLCLSVFTMFELIEAVSGRLIGPKAWNRIVMKF